MTLTYVYCLVRSDRRPGLRRGTRPVPGALDLDLLAGGDDIWLVVSHVSDSQYDEAALATGLRNMDWVAARAIAHETVVEQFLGAPAVLPMQLLTLFTSDERALAYVARNRRRIERVLSRVARQHEWGVRLTFDEKAARRQATESRPGPVGRSQTARKETGAGYLARKRDQRDLDRARIAQARTDGNRAYQAIRREATAARRRKHLERNTASGSSGSRLLVDAALLVPIARTGAFRATLRREARALGDAGVAVSLTGPWPAYNFIDEVRRRS